MLLISHAAVFMIVVKGTQCSTGSTGRRGTLYREVWKSSCLHLLSPAHVDSDTAALDTFMQLTVTDPMSIFISTYVYSMWYNALLFPSFGTLNEHLTEDCTCMSIYYVFYCTNESLLNKYWCIIIIMVVIIITSNYSGPEFMLLETCHNTQFRVCWGYARSSKFCLMWSRSSLTTSPMCEP